MACIYCVSGQACPVCQTPAPKPVACPACRGTGFGPCPACACTHCRDARGVVQGKVIGDEGLVDCPACGGTKRGEPCAFPRACASPPCQACGGAGKMASVSEGATDRWLRGAR